MIQLELGGQRWPLVAGESVIGSGASAAVRLERPGVLDRHALVQVASSGAAIRLAVPDAEVAVNGVRLGGDPVPLLHGDKVRVGTAELAVVDERKAGTTQMADAAALRAATEGAAAPSAAPSPASGGRVVSLTDGREYAIGEAALVFGREASCDVVIDSSQVSRKHATVSHGPDGYTIEDQSANGVLVNGTRVSGQRTLARGDVLKIGPAEFRFYAEAAPVPPTPPPGAAHRLYDTAHGLPSMVPTYRSSPTAAPPLATVLVRTGGLRGQRLPIRTPVVNIGRADYNDLVFGEESVSASHAKLQRREDVWVVTDLDSTNGTFVDGERVRGEAPLMAGSTVRFGDVSMLFDPTDARGPQPKGGGTRLVGAIAIPDTPRMPASRPVDDGERAARKARPTPAPAGRTGRTGRLLLALVVLAAAAAAAYYIFGR